MEVTDQELLREFAARRCEKSFRQLVDRHVRMVFCVAHRVTGDPQLAEEIAQTTFTTLAGKADQIESNEALAGWLYHTARHLALRAIRSEQRRRQREQIAITMNTDEPDPGVVAEHLEAAMDQLKPEDRDALVLRFFEDRNLRDVGHELGLSEDAARMRVNRSLEKLRSIFGKLGISGTSAWLASALPTSATAAVIPSGLGASIVTTVLGGAAVATTAAVITQTTSSTMTLFNLKTAAVAIAAAAITGTSTYLVKEKEVDQLRSEQSTMASDYGLLTTEHEQAMALVQSRAEQIQRLKADLTDVPRLRGEIDDVNRKLASMESALNENARLSVENSSLSEKIRMLEVGTVEQQKAEETAPKLFTRTYSVASDDFVLNLKRITNAKNERLSGTELLEICLRQAGVEIAPPSMCWLDEANDRLIVRGDLNTLERLNWLVAVIDQQQSRKYETISPAQ